MKKPTQEQMTRACLQQIDYLLGDWQSNIINFQIVKEDILQRIKTGLPKYIEAVQLDDKL